ncbi:XRE family transcriptional regulator [Microcoleus sp. N3A4]|uniref:XRE family transcriptional regulator n=1 Tax=Microcoleus sp. N3A4 TaxID=3055379 RepID=UPI002FD5EAB2
MTQEPIFEESSGKVFADLGLKDADALFTRGKIGIQVIRILKQRNLKQHEISQLFGIPQPEVSHLKNADIALAKFGSKSDLAAKLNKDVVGSISVLHL